MMSKTDARVHIEKCSAQWPVRAILNHRVCDEGYDYQVATTLRSVNMGAAGYDVLFAQVTVRIPDPHRLTG